MAKSSHRSTTILQRVCILYQSRLAPMMDVKKLNVFQWCRFLRHAGRCVMMVFVLVIISGLVVASFSTTLQQGMTSDNVWLRVGSYLLSLIYMLTVIMTVWTYMATMLASPGIVPCGWHPFGDLESSGQSTTSIMSAPKGGHRSRNDVAHNDQVARRTADEDVYLMMGNNLQRTVDSNRTVAESWNEALRQAHKPRWCRKCNAWKPPRCHHCSVSGRCVLKMDHYCVWVSNTIGLLNYKYFVLFIFWAWLGCLISSGLLLKPSIAFFSGNEVAIAESVIAFIGFVFSAAFTLALTGFLIMHGSLIRRNQTTIEAYEKTPISPWPYDRGSTSRNFRDVFGLESCFWLIPVIPQHEKQRLLSETLDIVVPLPMDTNQETQMAIMNSHSNSFNVVVENNGEYPAGHHAMYYDIEHGLHDEDGCDLIDDGLVDNNASFARSESERLEKFQSEL